MINLYTVGNALPEKQIVTKKDVLKAFITKTPVMLFSKEADARDYLNALGGEEQRAIYHVRLQSTKGLGTVDHEGNNLADGLYYNSLEKIPHTLIDASLAHIGSKYAEPFIFEKPKKKQSSSSSSETEDDDAKAKDSSKKKDKAKDPKSKSSDSESEESSENKDKKKDKKGEKGKHKKKNKHNSSEANRPGAIVASIVGAVAILGSISGGGLPLLVIGGVALATAVAIYYGKANQFVDYVRGMFSPQNISLKQGYQDLKNRLKDEISNQKEQLPKKSFDKKFIKRLDKIIKETPDLKFNDEGAVKKLPKDGGPGKVGVMFLANNGLGKVVDIRKKPKRQAKEEEVLGEITQKLSLFKPKP